MEAKERMTLLMAQVSEDSEDELVSELIELEALLTIHEFLLLLKVADLDGTWLWEPIQFEVAQDDKALQRRPFASVVGLSQGKLLRLSQQVRLQDLGLLELQETENGWELMLTPKGAYAVDWWLSNLEEVGLKHEELMAGSFPCAPSSNPSTTNS